MPEDDTPQQPELPLPFPEFTGDLPLLPARMVNEYQYCPRLAYLEWVQGEWAAEGHCGPLSAAKGRGLIEARRVKRYPQLMCLLRAASYVFTLLCGAGAVAGTAEAAQHAWAALAAGGHVALLRHANAPGTGDPQAVRIGDCKTQRNLDDAGRDQARALGGAFRERRIRVDRVLSSPWCRTLETARLMALGDVEVSWSLVPDRGQTPPVRAQELKQLLSSWRGPGTLVLVSHGFAIQALYGFIPGSGEMLVLKPNGASSAGADLVGRIPPAR